MNRVNIFRLTAIALLSLASLFSISTLAQQSNLSNMLPTNSNLLFIQVANSGELIPNNEEPNTYRLVLKQVDPFTSYFTDRPNRSTGLVSTNQFVDIWNSETDISKSPPNVAIETSNIQNGTKINRVLVLTNPTYDADKQEVTYTAKILGKKPTPMKRLSIGYTVLFIDDFNWNGNKFG